MATMHIPVTKSKGTVEIDTDSLPDEVYKEALLQGLKVLVNRGMSKITKETYTNPEELKAAAQAKAVENAADIAAGKVKMSGATKTKKASGVVMTEARRLAKNLVKDEMKRQGIKISHVDAKEITAAANELLDSEGGKSLIAQAETNIADRDKVDVKAMIDVKALVKESPTKVAKAEAKKAEAKGTLSAKQAGKVAPRAKPQAVPATVQ